VGVGFARLVEVSNVSVFGVVDMPVSLAAKPCGQKQEAARCNLLLTQC
jgi:hypothetical protein